MHIAHHFVQLIDGEKIFGRVLKTTISEAIHALLTADHIADFFTSRSQALKHFQVVTYTSCERLGFFYCIAAGNCAHYLIKTLSFIYIKSKESARSTAGGNLVGSKEWLVLCWLGKFLQSSTWVYGLDSGILAHSNAEISFS